MARFDGLTERTQETATGVGLFVVEDGRITMTPAVLRSAWKLARRLSDRQRVVCLRSANSIYAAVCEGFGDDEVGSRGGRW